MVKKFETILKYFNSNKDDKSLSWLEFSKCFGDEKNIGKLFISSNEELPVTFKIPKYIDYMSKREAIIMKGLNELHKFCPHFCRLYGQISHSIDINYEENRNPFQITRKYPIFIENNIMEFIEGYNLYEYLEKNKYKIGKVISLIKQVLLCLHIA